jgi:small-conductance mechanosensitive channel/CRP-like cAMP-binding protein
VAGLLSSLPAQVLAGLALLAVAAGVRLVTTNRVVRSRVRLTIVLALIFIGINAALASPTLVRTESRALAVSIGQLVFAFAIIHFLVLVLVNPLRADRVPERFPTIVQDVAVFTLFALVATLVLEEKFVTTSAVGAVVAGLALQDTLGNLVSGLAIQVEKPFRLGHWIRLGEWEGEVSEITWRAVKVRTREGNEVIIPNGELAKSALVNFSEPTSPTRIFVEVGASYDDAPNTVRAVMLEALRQEPLVLKVPAPHVHLVEFAGSSVNYQAHFWIERLSLDEVAKDRVRTAIYYAFKRRGISIPFPIQVQYNAEASPLGPSDVERQAWEKLLASTDLFGLLTEEDRHRLVSESRIHMFGDGEIIVRQDEPGQSAYVVCDGQVRVTLEPGETELAVLGAGSYFGEMSLLTGDVRTATVRSHGDCRVLEITPAEFRRVILDNPALLERIGSAVAERRAGIAHAQSATANHLSVESATSLGARVRRFFRI